MAPLFVEACAARSVRAIRKKQSFFFFNHEATMGITNDIGTVGGCVYAVSLMLDSFCA